VPPLTGRVVRDHQHFGAVDATDAGDHPRTGRRAVIQPVRGERRQFEQGRARIEQRADALAWQQFAALGVLRARLLATAERRLGHLAAQVLDRGAQLRGIGLEFGGTDVELRMDGGHGRRWREAIDA
jgi:hypothetical protein